MAVRSFQQIIDAHEAAQAMLRSLEVDVRDTLADAKAELERFQTKNEPRADGTVQAYPSKWAVGDRFVVNLRDEDNDGTSTGTVYTLVTHGRRELTGYPLAFVDDDGDIRIFYDFWHDLITKVA